MNMHDHILAAMREQFDHWESVLANLSDEQITTPQFDDNWSIKDVVAHLWGWQQISVARAESAVLNREPRMPDWVVQLHGVWEVDADRTNAAIYQLFHELPWSEVHRRWRQGYLRFVELGEFISEKDFLDGDTYPWLKGNSVAAYFLGSYEHHQEHIEKLLAWLENGGTTSTT
jgi:hypothetical protein